MSSNLVFSRGPISTDWMVIGEAPGRKEYELGKPFVGPSGEAQDWYFKRHGLDPSQCYVTNVIKSYTVGNPDPTEEQIAEWTPYLISEIYQIRPKIIIAAGRFAARWLLGEETELEIAHGMPYSPGFYDPSRADRCPADTIIIPAYHPAAGFYRPEPRTLIDWDYKQAARHLATLRAGRPVAVPYDAYAGKEQYFDVTGNQLADYLCIDWKSITEIGIDTESTPSIQVSWQDGVAFTLRACHPDFHVGVSALQRLVDSGILVILHDAGTPRGCCYDMVECRKLGLELRYANLFNTMTAIFKLRFESRSLKVAAERFLRCKMTDYEQIIGDVGRQKAIDYLEQARQLTWPKTDWLSEEQPDGTWKLVKPKSVNTRIEGILRDIAKGKCTKDGPTDPYKRWKQIPKVLRKPVEQRFGPIPEGDLADIPLEQSTYYASRDADVTRRLMPYLVNRLATENPPDVPSLRSVFDTSNACLPFFETMQYNGIQGSKRLFLDFASDVTSNMRELRTEISTRFYGKKPFNPRSPVDVRSLMRRRGLEAELTTPSGDPSTSQDSIGHLIDDEAIGLVFDYREMATLLSNYVEPIIDIIEDTPDDAVTVHYWIKPVTVEHRRISTEKPNILATPSRSALAKKVRACYRVHDPSLCWVAVDFSGQEMRCAADLSRDPRLMDVFINGGDAHRLSAAYVYHQGDESLVTKDERRAAKTINFGILYGMAGRGLQKQMRKNGIKIELAECQRLHRGVLRDAYPGIAECIEKVGRDAMRSGVVYDPAGMPRYLPQLWSKDQKEVAEAKRQAFSHKNSGYAQALTQHAMRYLWPQVIDIQREGYRLDPVAQFHDELIFLTEKRIAPYVVELVRDAFINHSDGEIGLTLSVPIEADGHIGDTWAALK